MILATGGIGKSFKFTSNSWEYTGDGHALALQAGGSLLNMEFIQFHPTGMVWPPSVRGILVTESVRGDGGVLRNSEGRRFMYDYIPEFFRSETSEDEAEGDRWYEDKANNRRPPELLPRDEVARAINSEVKAGRGSPHGGVFLDIASRRTAEFIKRRLPSMHHQFEQLAGVDITKEPMEIGPTCHYVMGGVEVEPDTAAAVGVPGLYAAGEVAGGMHGANRLGGNSLSDLLVFGRRAGIAAAEYAGAHQSGRDPGRGARSRTRSSEVARAVRARRHAGRGEPVHAAPGAAGDDAGAGRHHPHQATSWSEALADIDGVRRARRASSPSRATPPVQPGLAPGHGRVDDAHRVALRRDGGAGARGEPRRSHPRRLPEDRPRLGQGQPDRSPPTTAAASRSTASRCRRCPTSWPPC